MPTPLSASALAAAAAAVGDLERLTGVVKLTGFVASVPELTRRTRSTGVRATISSASSISASVGAPNDSPVDAARCTASTTAGYACPRIIGPHEHTRST